MKRNIKRANGGDSSKIVLLVSLHVIVVALVISLSLFDFDNYKNASDKITGATTAASDSFNSALGLYLFLLIALVVIILFMILLSNNKK